MLKWFYTIMNKTIYELINTHVKDHKFAKMKPNEKFNGWYVVFDGVGGLSCVKFGNKFSTHSLNDIDEGGKFITEYNVNDILAMKFYESYFEYNSELKTEEDVIKDFLKYFDWFFLLNFVLKLLMCKYIDKLCQKYVTKVKNKIVTWR